MNKVVLSSIIDVISGGTPKTKVAEYWNGNVGWLSVTDFNSDLRYVYKTEKTITDLGVQKSNTKYLEKGDIIISARGTVGALAQIGKPMCFNQSCFGIRGKKEIADTDFLYYSLKNYVKHIVKRSQGSVFDTINLKSFDLMEIEIPKDLQTQKAIAKVLSDLDAKIELNNKINAELEAMAKLIYDYWFVQFDFPCLPENYKFSGASKPKDFNSILTYTQVGGLPVPDGKKWFVYVIECTDGSFYKGMTNDLYRRYYEHKTGQGAEWTITHKPKKIIHYETFSSQKEAAKREKELKTGYGRTWLKREYEKFIKYGYVPKSGLPAHQTRLMMAGKMVYNEELKREIPEGWDSGTFETVATIIGGSTPSKAVAENFTNENNMPWITPKDLSNNKGKKYITRGEWDVTELGIKSASLKIMPANSILLSSRAPIGYLAISREEVTTNQGFKSFVPKSHYSSEFIYYCVKNQIPKIEANASGSTFKEVSATTLKMLSISIPPENILMQYYKKAKPIFKNQNVLELENQKLAELRDWLLPMLMNGQVTVGEAEEKTQINMAAEDMGEYNKG